MVFKSFIGFIKENKYSVFVACMLMLTYTIQQCNTYSLIATNPSMAQELEYGDRQCEVEEDSVAALEDYLQQNGINQTASDYCYNREELCADDVSANMSWCYWYYTGQGFQYQVLAGPIYIVMFAVSGILLGMTTEIGEINKVRTLSVCIITWSIMTTLGGFAQEYWHIALCRLLLGVFAAGCVPFSTSLISSYFSKEQRAAAIGFFYWGIFLGYSLSFVLIIAVEQLGWRPVYFITGIPGIIMGIVVLLTVKNPKIIKVDDDKSEDALSKYKSLLQRLKRVGKCFIDPVLLMLCFAGAIRNGAGIVWAYNIVLYFGEYYPDTNVTYYMCWIPLIFGSAGSFGGGFLSDRLSRNRGVKGRLLVLIGCCLCAAPFQVGLLVTAPPWAFVCHIGGYLVGEMWLGVCVAIVIELVPSNLSASAVAVYFFIIQIIGGNMTLFVTPLTNALNYRAALIILFPGMYVAAALLFIVTLLMVSYRERNSTAYDMNKVKPLEKEEQSDSSAYGSTHSLDKTEHLEMNTSRGSVQPTHDA